MSDLLIASGLTKDYGHGRHRERVVNDVNFTIAEGETLALVGESGAGKSTVARMVLRLIEPTQGSVVFRGTDVVAMRHRELRSWRSNAQMVFQDPFEALDPRRSIMQSVAEPLIVHFDLTRSEREDRVEQLLKDVGLGTQVMRRFPYEMSGGQLQRVCIARALGTNPSLLVCDEPVAALDASLRSLVINLLQDLQEERGIAYLFISHDLWLVKSIADRVIVMRHGVIRETGAVEQVFEHPSDPYTQELLDAAPVADPRIQRAKRAAALAGAMSSLEAPE